MAKTKLKDLEVTEVSLVDAGANQHAHVTLYKRDGGKPGDHPAGQEPEQAQAKSGLHKFFSAIGKALKLDQTEIDSAVASIEKADTFNQKMEERKLRRKLARTAEQDRAEDCRARAGGAGNDGKHLEKTDEKGGLIRKRVHGGDRRRFFTFFDQDKSDTVQNQCDADRKGR